MDSLSRNRLQKRHVWDATPPPLNWKTLAAQGKAFFPSCSESSTTCSSWIRANLFLPPFLKRNSAFTIHTKQMTCSSCSSWRYSVYLLMLFREGGKHTIRACITGESRYSIGLLSLRASAFVTKLWHPLKRIHHTENNSSSLLVFGTSLLESLHSSTCTILITFIYNPPMAPPALRCSSSSQEEAPAQAARHCALAPQCTIGSHMSLPQWGQT